MVLPFNLTCPRHGHLRRVQHIFDEDAVARGGVVDHNVRYRADELTVLNDRASAHSLDDSSGFIDQALVLNLYGEAFACVGASIDTRYFYLIALRCCPVECAIDICAALA